jgi:hypothetical protein
MKRTRRTPFSKPLVEYVWNGGVANGTTIDAKMIRDSEELEAAFRETARSDPMPSWFNPTCRADGPPS